MRGFPYSALYDTSNGTIIDKDALLASPLDVKAILAIIETFTFVEGEVISRISSTSQQLIADILFKAQSDVPELGSLALTLDRIDDNTQK